MSDSFSSTTRRGFLRAVVAPTVAAGAGAVGYGWAIEPHWYELVERPLPLADLPAAWHGKRLLHLSDLHIGPCDEAYLTDALSHAAKLAPDLVVVTGDFMSYRSPEQFEQVERILATLGRPPHGIFGTFGNHDYGPQWSNVRLADELEKRLDGIGVRVLRNEATRIDDLRLVGIEDMWSPRFQLMPLRRALGEARDGASLILCHNPDACDLPLWDGVRGWVLAGHTHGGQCRPPFLPPPIVPVRNKRYARGEVTLDDGRTLYVSRGLGYSFRLRFNARPEMTLFTLTSA